MKTISFFIANLFLAAGMATACDFHHNTRVSAAIGLSDKASAQSSITPFGNVTHSFSGNGVSSSLGLGMQIDDGLWGDFHMQMRALKAETEVNIASVSTHSAGILPIMVGLRYYPFFDTDTKFQPFVLLRGGPVIAIEEKSSVDYAISNEAHTETTMGYQYGAGVNLLLTHWLAFDISGAYLKMNKLENPINGATRFNGWDISFGFSLFWG